MRNETVTLSFPTAKEWIFCRLFCGFLAKFGVVTRLQQEMNTNYLLPWYSNSIEKLSNAQDAHFRLLTNNLALHCTQAFQDFLDLTAEIEKKITTLCVYFFNWVFFPKTSEELYDAEKSIFDNMYPDTEDNQSSENVTIVIIALLCLLLIIIAAKKCNQCLRKRLGYHSTSTELLSNYFWKKEPFDCDFLNVLLLCFD